MILICRNLIALLMLVLIGNAYADPQKALEAYKKKQFKTAYKEFRKSAFKGNSDSQYNLAVMLYTGKGVAKDKAEAIYWFVKAAENGDQSAQYNLGVLYTTDKELPTQYPKMEDGDIYFEIGGKRSSNSEKAFKWYKMAAEQGHESAQLNLGVIYNQGLGVEQDFKQAAIWYEKAAKKKNSKAQLNLGILYDLGKGVNKDIVKASELYKLAAKQGVRDAQYNLGIIYYNGGEGVEKNLLESFAWLALAKEQGSELAAIYKKKIEKKFKGSEKKKARNLAIQYYRSYLKPFQK